MLSNLYRELGRVLRTEGHQIEDLLEVSDVHKRVTRIPLYILPSLTEQFKEYLRGLDYPLVHRENMEYFHYEKLFNTLAHALGENYFYLKENVKTSRRIIAISTDCISVIQCKGQEDSMGLHVFMRSSHYHNLLPVDLLFLLNIIPRYIEAAKKIQKTFEIKKWGTYLDDLEFMDLHLTFGSLHTHQNLL